MYHVKHQFIAAIQNGKYSDAGSNEEKTRKFSRRMKISLRNASTQVE